MNDFEAHPIGTAKRIAELERKVSSARLACEFGFICHEKGMNLERALSEYDALNDAPPNLVREFTDEEMRPNCFGNYLTNISCDHCSYWRECKNTLPAFLKKQAD